MNNCGRNNNCNNLNNYNDYTNYNTSNNSNSYYNHSNVFPTNYLYGHAYTPNQCMNQTFSPEIGLNNGTLFPELVSPYRPGQSMDFIEFLRSGGRNNERM